MSHSDKLSRLPKGFATIAETPNSPFAGIASLEHNVFGIVTINTILWPELYYVQAFAVEVNQHNVNRANHYFKGVQFHPEVNNTPLGGKVLQNFAVNICGCKANWTMSNFVDQEIARVRKLVGETSQVIGAVSGGMC